MKILPIIAIILACVSIVISFANYYFCFIPIKKEQDAAIKDEVHKIMFYALSRIIDTKSIDKEDFRNSMDYVTNNRSEFSYLD